MPEAVIKIGDIKDPEPGKKRYKVISFQNEVFQINPELVPLFVKGKSYKIFYENRQFQDRKFKEIPGRPELVPEISTGQQKKAEVLPQWGPDHQEVIWCCAMLKEEICSGRVSGQDAVACQEIVEAQKLVYRRCFGNLVEEESQEDLRQTEFPGGFKTPRPSNSDKANAHKVGSPAPADPGFDDDIPY